MLMDTLASLRFESPFDGPIPVPTDPSRDEAGRWALMMSRSRDGIVLIAAESCTAQEVNPAFAAMLGYTPNEMLGLHAWDWDTRFSREQILAMAESQGAGEFLFETTMRRKTGEDIEVEVSSSRLDWEGRHYFLCICRNISERKAAERAVREEMEWRRLAMECSRDGVAVMDDATKTVCEVNSTFAEMLGYPADELIGTHPWDWDATFTREQILSGQTKAQASGTGFRNRRFETIHRRKDGTTFEVEVTTTNVVTGSKGYSFCVCRDISERKATERKLKQREELYTAVIKQAPDSLVLTDMETLRFVEFNDKACTGLGYTRAEFARLSLLDIQHTMTLDDVRERMNQFLAQGSGSFENVHRRKDGSLRTTRITMRVVNVGDRNYMIGFWTDITESKRLETELRQREEYQRALLDNFPFAVWLKDEQGRYLAANAACALFPAERAEQLGVGDRMVLATGNARQVEECIPVDGKSRWFDVYQSPVMIDGQVIGTVGFSRDVTETVDQRRQIHRLAFTDVLTGLPNRAAFNQRIEQASALAHRELRPLALMLVDLDHFKDVNDTLGHGAGDALLCEATKRMAACLRSADTIARLGGDEFAVLLPSIRTAADAAIVAEKLLAELARPFHIAGQDVFISGSIGIAIAPGDGSQVDELFACADAAMYDAKRQGRNKVQFYAKELSQNAARRMAIIGDLHQACAGNQLALFYQPKVNMADGSVIGAEALLRWQHPKLGLLTPDKFIAIAEDTGLIHEIGRWVLEEACRAARRWNGHGGSPIKIAINLSCRQFRQPGLAQLVRDTLETTGCRGAWLEFEITESMMLDDSPEIQNTLDAFRRLGITIAIDDFGTGHSALGYLNRFKIDVLKIDRSFVNGMEQDLRKAELVKAFISMAHALGVTTVAEGVERAEQAALLKELGCRIAQGYLFGRPVPEAQFSAAVSG